MLWIVSLIALAGVILNVKRNRWGFALWIATNAVWAVVDLKAGLYAQAALMAVYWVLAVWGFVSWGQRKRFEQAILVLQNSKLYWQRKLNYHRKGHKLGLELVKENVLTSRLRVRIAELDAAIKVLRGN